MKKQEEERTKSQRLTLDEMLEIFMGDAYKDFRERCKLSIHTTDNGEKYVPIIIGWPCTDVSPLLYRHIVAEQMLQGDYHHKDWELIYDTCRYFAMLELWMNPLVWKDALEYDDIVIAGRIAEEEYDSHRLIEISNLLNYARDCAIQDFANDIFMYDEDDYEGGHVKGMHEWHDLTSDVDDITDKIINGGHVTYDEIHSAKYYDIASMRYHLITIARLCGSKRAAEILHMFQDEWPKIKIWKTRFDTMTEDDIRQFEEGLFSCFDDLLEEWGDGANAQKEQQKTIRRAKNQSISRSMKFEQLLQCDKSDKGRVMKRLHELLDGKGGKDVAIVLAAAMYKYKYLLHMPSEKQYTAVFELPELGKLCDRT